MRRTTRTIALVRRALPVLLLLLVAASASHLLRVDAHARRQAAQRYEDVYYLPPPTTLRLFSLGYDEALADLIWLRALVYFGEEFEHGGDLENVFAYAEAMVALDPRFSAVYRWVGIAGLYRPTAVSTDDIETSVRFMQRGAAIFPEDGALAWDIGAALVYELAPLLDDEDAKVRVRERGIPYLMSAARLGAAPEWAVLSNAAVLDRLGQTEQAARHLEEMYANTDDPGTRARIAERIQSLRASADARAFLAATDESEAVRRRDFPYVPSGLHVLLGARPPVDLDAPIRLGLPRALTDDAAEPAP